MSQEVNPSYSGEVDIAKAKAPKILNREELVKAIVDHKKNTQEMRAARIWWDLEMFGIASPSSPKEKHPARNNGFEWIRGPRNRVG